MTADQAVSVGVIEFEIVETAATRYALGPAALAAAGLPAELAALQELLVDDVFEVLLQHDVPTVGYEVRERWLVAVGDANDSTNDSADDSPEETNAAEKGA